jgi:hypothetical protein
LQKKYLTHHDYERSYLFNNNVIELKFVQDRVILNASGMTLYELVGWSRMRKLNEKDFHPNADVQMHLLLLNSLQAKGKFNENKATNVAQR